MRGRGKSVWKRAYGLKIAQRFELFCQLFSLSPPVEPAGSYKTFGIKNKQAFLTLCYLQFNVKHIYFFTFLAL